MLHAFSSRPPTPQNRRRFRILVGLFVLAVVGAVFLQYTPYHLFPERKTDTLWGVLVGAALMTAFAEYQWTASTRRDQDV